MFSFLRKKFREDKGFTLVELLVVIGILGILTSVAVPTYTGFQKKARQAATQAELQAIRMAWNFYDVERGTDAFSEAVDGNDDIETLLGEYLDFTNLHYSFTWNDTEKTITATPDGSYENQRATATITKDGITFVAE